MNVCGIEILAAARKPTLKMEIENFRGTNGWLWRPRSTRTFKCDCGGEVGDADTASIEPLRTELNGLLEDKHLSYSPVYNGDEMGFF